MKDKLWRTGDPCSSIYPCICENLSSYLTWLSRLTYWEGKTVKEELDSRFRIFETMLLNFRPQNTASASNSDESQGNSTQQVRESIEHTSGGEMQNGPSEVLAFVYCSQGKWNEAEKILERLENSKPHGKHALKAMHAVARFYLNDKQYAKAQKWCEEAIYWWKATVGDRHVLYYLSINLLAGIYDAQGKLLESERYRNGLPSNFEGMLT